MMVEALVAEHLNKIAWIERLDPGHVHEGVDNEPKQIKIDHRASYRQLKTKLKQNAMRREWS
jgi:hypothetical protein